ncbi:Crp/Fnr family transcriptional regulator, partial [bacterium]|nr:Crp/Fnr family transcriptional regulator [bacterium]
FVLDQAKNFEYAFFTKKIKRNQIIYLMGDPSNELFLLQKGRVRVSVISLDGKEKTVEMIRPGGFFGQMCLCPDGRRKDQAVAFEESIVASIKARMFFELLNSKPEVVGLFLGFFCSKMTAAREQLDLMVSDHEKMRFAKLLLKLGKKNGDKNGKTHLNLSQEELARMLSTDRPAVSALLGRFKRDGLIDYKRQQITIDESKLIQFLLQ